MLLPMCHVRAMRTAEHRYSDKFVSNASSPQVEFSRNSLRIQKLARIDAAFAEPGHLRPEAMRCLKGCRCSRAIFSFTASRMSRLRPGRTGHLPQSARKGLALTTLAEEICRAPVLRR